MIQPQIPSGGLVIQGGDRCQDKILPLYFMIVLDVTGSMDNSIDGVKNNLTQFAAKLKALKIQGTDKNLPDIKLGVLTFVDSPDQDQTFPLTSDVSSLGASIAGIGTRGGIHDRQEGGLGAVLRGFQALAAAGGSQEFIPAVLVISDNYGHTGEGSDGVRNFSPAALTQLLSGAAFNNFLLFDAVPVERPSGLFEDASKQPPNVTPAGQWQEIRGNWKAAHAGLNVDPGMGFGFPFTSDVFLGQLPAQVEKFLKICK